MDMKLICVSMQSIMCVCMPSACVLPFALCCLSVVTLRCKVLFVVPVCANPERRSAFLDDSNTIAF